MAGIRLDWCLRGPAQMGNLASLRSLSLLLPAEAAAKKWAKNPGVGRWKQLVCSTVQIFGRINFYSLLVLMRLSLQTPPPPPRQRKKEREKKTKLLLLQEKEVCRWCLAFVCCSFSFLSVVAGYGCGGFGRRSKRERERNREREELLAAG